MRENEELREELHRKGEICTVYLHKFIRNHYTNNIVIFIKLISVVEIKNEDQEVNIIFKILPFDFYNDLNCYCSHSQSVHVQLYYLVKGYWVLVQK